MSRLFSACMGRPDGRVSPFYGERGRIFKERLDLLKLAVDHQFMVAPNQEQEGRFDRLVETTTWFADRRNEVAHSVVYDLSDWKEFASRRIKPVRLPISRPDRPTQS